VFLELKINSEQSQFCSTVVLLHGSDESFEYIACGAEATTQTLFPVPNAAVATTTPSPPSSVPSNSLSGSTSQAIATAGGTTSIPASSSSPGITSALVSSTSGPIPASTQQQAINTGAIVGGALGGLIVICLTILGAILIRRKHGVKEQAMPYPGYTHNGQGELNDNAQKPYGWDSSHDPVEMDSEHHISAAPVELSGQTQYTNTPSQARL
jgi:hypothetical protein